MEDHVRYLEEHAEKSISIGALTNEMLRFYSELYANQQRLCEHYKNDTRLPALKQTELPISRHVKHIFSSKGVSDLHAGGIVPLAGIMTAHNPGLDLKEAARALAEDRGALETAADAVLNLDTQRLEQFAVAHKTGADETIFLIINWLKPFFTALREKNRDRITDSDDVCLCPFCGYHADMAAIVSGMDGKRFLYCSLCGHRWQYRRIACAVCGTEDADKLEYLSSEDDTSYRIDVCNACGGYIKTVQLGKFQDIEECDLAVENILTSRLDSAAMQKGYKRP